MIIKETIGSNIINNLTSIILLIVISNNKETLDTARDMLDKIQLIMNFHIIYYLKGNQRKNRVIKNKVSLFKEIIKNILIPIHYINNLFRMIFIDLNER